MMTEESTAWVRLQTAAGEAELHLNGDRWEVWTRRRVGDGDLRLSASGSIAAGPESMVGIPVSLAPEKRCIVIGDIEIDNSARKVKVAGVEVRLSNKEHQLLNALAADPTRVFTKAELLRDVWSLTGSRESSRTLDSHVSRLRRKLTKAGGFNGGCPYIINSWGVGYRLVGG